jgi:uncharacterized damage-inducible protein DinB
MSLREALLGELEHEAGNTRKTLERVPSAQLGWRPHEKSFTLGELASHIARILTWLPVTVRETSFDVASPEGQAPFEVPPSTDGILDLFDENLAMARAALQEVDDAALGETWTLRNGDQTIFSMPRVAVLRAMILNHTVHHRGQLTVYLRMVGAKVPSLYGPSADEEA